MSTVVQRFARHLQRVARGRPVTAHGVLAAAHTAILTAPALTLAAILTGHTILALAGTLASTLCYLTGYHTAAVRCTRRLRAAVAAARRDKLTGLPTRAVADEALDTATRDGTDLTVALADVDGLHAINTNLGHAAGDQYLRVVAQRLARALPDGGCLVRQGGDEFTLLVPGRNPDEVATAIGAAMAGPAVIAGYRIQPRVSIGIAASGGGDARHTRACADAAMYTAKAAGGNHTRIYQPGRDGQPAPDGTRPPIRRRDLDPAGVDGLAWLPSPGDTLLPLMFSLDEVHTVVQALRTAHDRQRGNGTDPIPGQLADRIADRIAPIVEAGHRLAADGHTRGEPVGVASTVLVGISAAFTGPEIEGLVITAAEAVYGNTEDLSLRQRELAGRAYDLLQADLAADTDGHTDEDRGEGQAVTGGPDLRR